MFRGGAGKEVGFTLNKIEGVFINGMAQSLDRGVVRPGDRVAFIPPGTPGPYRVILGIVKGSDK